MISQHIIHPPHPHAYSPPVYSGPQYISGHITRYREKSGEILHYRVGDAIGAGVAMPPTPRNFETLGFLSDLVGFSPNLVFAPPPFPDIVWPPRIKFRVTSPVLVGYISGN